MTRFVDLMLPVAYRSCHFTLAGTQCRYRLFSSWYGGPDFLGQRCVNMHMPVKQIPQFLSDRTQSGVGECLLNHSDALYFVR